MPQGAVGRPMAEGVTETATLGGGCFWCLEAVFEQLEGVERVVSGYAGGTKETPTYEEVCTGATGHAEVVQVVFDPAVIGYRDLLEVFFSIHDPTTPDRQGPDVGTQYRSVVFTHGPGQAAWVARVLEDLAKEDPWGRPVVTQVEPLTRFYPAEDYHQGYYRRNPDQGYCNAVITPKLAKFRARWAARIKAPA